jgi:hypothetical protein
LKKNLKNIILLIIDIICLILIFILSYNFIYSSYKQKSLAEDFYINFFNKNSNSPFYVSKIIAYSSAYGENQSKNLSKGNWVLKIYQYTDFAIFVNSNTEENYVSKLWIDNFKINKEPTLGVTSFYYENALKFGTENISTNYPIENNLEFTVLNDENSENTIQYNTPIFFADCSTPITFKYVNTVSSNFSLSNTLQLIQDGTILKNLIVNTSVIDCTFQFEIHLVDNNNVEYKSNVHCKIPLVSDKDSIISSGNILDIQNNLNNYFITK